LPDFGPLQSGYETFFGFRGGAVDYYTHLGASGDKDLWDGDVRVDQCGYLTELLADRSVRLIREFAQGSAPFLLSVHLSAPHWPWEAPGDEAEARRIAGKGLHHYDGGTQQVYRKMVEHMDAQVGRILDALSREGAARDTIVVFTSDNGGERFSDNWPFSGRKAELLEGGVRVPAILRWPRRIRGGRTSEQVMISMDWVPTLLAAAGVSPDPAYPSDGIDLLPLLGAGAAPRTRKLFWRFKSNAQRAVRDGNFKWLQIRGNSFLFDVVADPQERANLRDRHRDVFDRLAREWQEWNSTMLPELPESATAVLPAADVADRYGLSSKP
jgi:arylsulfatase A-like enzyme